MEINQLRVHEIAINMLHQSDNQEIFRIDDEGYEYVDDKYVNLYDAIVSRIWKSNTLIWI